MPASLHAPEDSSVVNSGGYVKRHFAECVCSMVVFSMVVLMTSLLAFAGKKTTNPNVTTIVHDYASDGVTQLLLRSDDYNGSAQASYGSFISGGELELLLFSQSVRTVWITPNDPVIASEPAGPPPGYYDNDTSVRSDCFDQNGNIVPLANVLTSSGNCKLGVTFSSGGTGYKLLMSPFPFSGSGDGTPICPSTGCPATGLATITCNKVSNGQCVSWTIVPNTGAANANAANLYTQGVGQGGTTTWTFIGQYYNTFRIDVTNP
jgi:hypothetical protein